MERLYIIGLRLSPPYEGYDCPPLTKGTTVSLLRRVRLFPSYEGYDCPPLTKGTTVPPLRRVRLSPPYEGGLGGITTG
jgi:hypothetical protein